MSCGTLRIFVAVCVLMWTMQTPVRAEAGLTAYRGVVTYLSQTEAEVTAQFSIEGGPRAQEIKLILYPDQAITAWHTNAGEPPSPLKGTGGTSIRVMPDAGGTYTVKYRVSSQKFLAHVPLPVPDALPATHDHFVQVETVLPNGSAVYDDAFPQKNWVDATHGKTKLPAVPSVVSVRFAPADAVSWRTGWKSVSRLSTLFMLLILLSGAAYLFRRRQSGRQTRRVA